MSEVHLIPEDDGLHRRGRDGPAMIVVARTAETIVCKMPSYRYNSSGIRGMRDLRHTAVTMFVFKVLREEGNTIVAEELISWQPAALRRGT